MFESNAQVKTDAASRYLKHLCKHFSHKVPAEWNDNAGSISFDIGRCELKATEAVLDVRCFAEDEQSLMQLKDVIKSHFERFAQKDSLMLDWAS